MSSRDLTTPGRKDAARPAPIARYAAFFSHKQMETSDRCNILHAEFTMSKIKVWFDLQQETLNADAMVRGVRDSAGFVLFASKMYVHSWYCQLEMITALDLKKPIMLIVDSLQHSSWCVTDHTLEKWLDTLYSSLMSHEKCTNRVKSLSLQGFKDSLVYQKRYYAIQRKTTSRLEMLQAIAALGGQSFIASIQEPKRDLSNVEILITGHGATGSDQCELLSIGLESLGIQAAVLSQEDDVEKLIAQYSALRGVIVFLTKDVLSDSVPVRTINTAMTSNKTLLGLFEDDSRKENKYDFGGVPDELSNDKNIRHFVNQEHVRFSQWDRTGSDFKDYIEKHVLSRLGMTLLLKSTDFDTSLRLAVESSNKLESGTREWLLSQMIPAKLQRARCVILAADAGLGKSCVFGALAKRHCSLLAHQLGAYLIRDDNLLEIGGIHFFQYSNNVERSARQCILSLAKQLCTSLPGFRSMLAECDIVNILKEIPPLKKLSGGDIRVLWDEFIIKPCHRILDHPVRITLLMDALDECAESEEMSKVIEVLWPVGDQDVGNHAPIWLSLIISTRRESTTLQNFSDFEPIVLEQVAGAQSSEEARTITELGLQDLRLTIKNRILKNSPINESTWDSIIDVILAKTEGVFLWFAYQEAELRSLASSAVLSSTIVINTLPKGLIGVYIKFFERVRAELGELEKEIGHSSLYATTLGVGVVAPREPIPQSLWRLLIGFGKDDHNTDIHFAQVRQVLSKLLIFDSSTDSIRAPHKSMVDFLKQDRKSKDLEDSVLRVLVYEKLAHDSLGRSMLGIAKKVIQHKKKWEMGEYSTEERYVFRHVVYHLSEATLIDAVCNLYLDIDSLIRLVDCARLDSAVPRIVIEGKALKVRASVFDPEQISLESMLDMTLRISALELAQEALESNALMLPGQLIGRIGAPPYDISEKRLETAVMDWVRSYKANASAPPLAMPIHPWLSGLSPAGSSLARILNFERSITCVAFGNQNDIFVASGSAVIQLNRLTGRRIRSFEGHSDAGISFAISSDSKWIVTGSRDVITVCVWDLESRERKLILKGHSNVVTSVAISSDSKWIVTGSHDNAARVWGLENRKTERVLEGHIGWVTSVAISSDSKWIVTGSLDNTARVWNLASGQVKSVLEGHSHGVTSVAISSDSKWIVTGSEDKTARMWDLESGKVNQVLEEHSGRVYSVAISSDSKWIATGSLDNTARVWEFESGKVKSVLKGHSAYVTSVAISSDSKWIVTGSEDKTARVWDLESGKPKSLPEGHSQEVTSVAVSSDSMWIVTGSRDNTARVWDLESGEVKNVLKGHSRTLTSIAISSDSKWIVTGSYDETARVWDLESGKTKSVLEAHSFWVTSVAISSDSKWIVTGSMDNTVRVWDLETGKVKTVLEGHSGEVTSIAISSDSKWIVTGSHDRTARTWDLESGKVNQVLEGHSGRVYSVAISSDSKWIVTGSWDKTARVWDLESGKTESVLEGYSKEVTSVAISSDSKWIVTGSNDEAAHVWYFENGKVKSVLEGHSSGEVTSVAISSDSKWIVTGSEDKTARVWDLESGKLKSVLEGHSDMVTSIAISSDSKWIVTGSEDETVRVWDLESGKINQILEGHSDWVASVAISPDSKWIVTGSGDQTARVWDLESGKVRSILKGHSDIVTSIAISSDSKWIVTGSLDNTARVWDLESGKINQILEGHSDWVASVAISPDSKWIVTGSGDQTARVWDLESGKVRSILKGHTFGVISVAISSDSKWIATGSLDNTARVWEFESGKVKCLLKGHSAYVFSVAISSDSKWIVTGSEDKTARVWDLESGKIKSLLEGHPLGVTSVAISSDSKWIVTGSWDKKARVWNLGSGKEQTDFPDIRDTHFRDVIVPMAPERLVRSISPIGTGFLLDQESHGMVKKNNLVFGLSLNNNDIFCWSLDFSPSTSGRLPRASQKWKQETRTSCRCCVLC